LSFFRLASFILFGLSDTMTPNGRSRTSILMALAFSLFSAQGVTGDSTVDPIPRWSVDLSNQWGLRPFQVDFKRAWTRQQNVVFLSPQRLAVYQVNELKAPADLTGRDVTGGGGNFFLEVRVFDVVDGHAVKAFRLRTNAELSEILPTHDGKWISRTGDVLSVMSPNLEILTSRKLLLSREARLELWQVAVTPSGMAAVLVHQQIFVMEDPHLGKPGRAITDVELINADTLASTKTFTIPHPLRAWSAGDGFLVSLDPSKSELDSRFGLLDFAGRWTSFRVDGDCRYEMSALRSQSIAGYGCGKLAVLSDKGEKLFYSKFDIRELVGSVDRGGDFLVVEFDREVLRDISGLDFSIHVPKPLRVEAYDLRTGKQLLNVPVHSDNVYYAISAQGALAIVDGSELKVFQMEH
jgi:hypothetical protein